jgi:hypothetical protein
VASSYQVATGSLPVATSSRVDFRVANFTTGTTGIFSNPVEIQNTKVIKNKELEIIDPEETDRRDRLAAEKDKFVQSRLALGVGYSVLFHPSYIRSARLQPCAFRDDSHTDRRDKPLKSVTAHASSHPDHPVMRSPYFQCSVSAGERRSNASSWGNAGD